MSDTDRDLLEERGLPIFFEIGNPEMLELNLPEDRHGQSVRVWARSLTVMQKEAISVGGGSGGTGKAGTADPVETHTYLDTNEGEDFARTTLYMGERTCFLHAFCRTELKTNLKVTRLD